MRGASGSAGPASQPALLRLPTRLQGSSPRRQRRLVKISAVTVALPQACSFLCKDCSYDVLQTLLGLLQDKTLEATQKQTLGITRVSLST